VAYLKPHGALYNRVVADQEQAGAVVDALLAYREADGRALPVLGLPGSVLLRTAAAAGLPVIGEAFADRGYTPAGTLVPRTEPGAVLHDPEAVVRRAVAMATDGEVVAADGSRIAVQARSLCLHGDTPGAAELAGRVRAALEAARVRVEAFA